MLLFSIEWHGISLSIQCTREGDYLVLHRKNLLFTLYLLGSKLILTFHQDIFLLIKLTINN